MRVLLPLALLFSFAAVACSGADEGRPQGLTRGEQPSEVDPCKASKGYEFLSLIDFEPHEIAGGALSTTVRCNPEISSDPCEFYFNYDMASSPANSDPLLAQGRGADCLELAVPEGAEVFSVPRLRKTSFDGVPIDDGRCGAESSGLNVVTENVGMCYGSDGRLGWGASLDITFKPALDASEWDGISLWVKNSPGGRKPAIIVQFIDPNTVGGHDPVTLKPTCDASDPAIGQQAVPDSQKCDYFGTAVTLTDEWTFVPARFDDLKQKGFGVISPLGHLKTDEINRMQVFMNAGNADFWIDDIALFRSAEQTEE